LHAWKNFEEIARGLDRRINERLGFQIDAASLLQKTKRKSGHDAKGVLGINASTRKCHGHVLLDAIVFRNIGKVNRSFQHDCTRRILAADGFDAE
jgi:hypothetical protein